MKKIKVFAFSVLVLFLFQINAFAWGAPGHMTVAQIAFDNLDSPAKKKRAGDLAKLVKLTGNSYNFTTAACWMDDIRGLPMFEPLKDWHFITQMNIIDNAVPNKPPPLINSTSIVEWLIDRLENGNDADAKKAFFLAELIHLVGDLHQPLHNQTRFTLTDKNGDTGGNGFCLTTSSSACQNGQNLHSFWDGAGGLFGSTDFGGRPLTPAAQTAIENFAQSIEVEHKKADMTQEIKELSPLKWAKEGFDIAKEEAYKGVTEKQAADSNYRDKVQKFAKRRIALGGYRLAAILNKIL